MEFPSNKLEEYGDFLFEVSQWSNMSEGSETAAKIAAIIPTEVVHLITSYKITEETFGRKVCIDMLKGAYIACKMMKDMKEIEFLEEMVKSE